MEKIQRKNRYQRAQIYEKGIQKIVENSLLSLLSHLFHSLQRA